MLPVKLPYYPQIQGESYVTPFGVAIVEAAEIYERPLPNSKHLIKVDALSSLYGLLGEEPFICRDLTFCVISGDNRTYDLQKVFASYYRKYPRITEYVNNIYVYGNNTVPMFDRAVRPLRNQVDAYKSKCMDVLQDAGGKYLVESKDILYYAFNVLPDLNQLSGVTVIC